MYLSSITANVLNKFNQQPINILYEPQYNLFDILLAECDINLFMSSNDKFINLVSNFIALKDHQFDLFNYNIGMTNSIIGYSQNKRYDNLHLNTIVFTHSYKPTQIKKEDAVLLKNNTKNSTKVFFDNNSKNSWRFDDAVVFSYGIPQNKFYIDSNIIPKTDRVLLLNLDQNPALEPLVEFLEKNNILIDILKEISCDSDLMRELLNQYDVCIDLSDHNISNLLVAIACGCKAITYATPMIMENYRDVPNLYTATTVQDLISTIQVALSSKRVDHLPYFSNRFSFDNFKTHINDLIIQNNNKAFIL